MAFLVNPPRWTAIAGPVCGIAVGVALMVAPARLGYLGSAQETAQRIAGPLMIMLWLPSFWEATRSLIWWVGVIALGLLIASPIAPGPIDARAAGISASLATLGAVLLTHPGNVAGRYAGGWAGLWRRSPADHAN